MLSALSLEHFTVFLKADCNFASGLNVIVGDNGTGKTHLLKTAYTFAHVSAWGERDSGSPTPNKSYLEKSLARKLKGVFRPDELGRLVQRRQGKARAEILAKFKTKSLRMGCSFNTASKTDVNVTTCPTKWEGQPPVYFPTRELLSIYPNFVSLYETSDVPFEETWRDTCLLLGAPLAKGPRLESVKGLLEPLESELGGKVELDGGRFYLKLPSGRMEAYLVAEGLRKLSMVARLVATGSLIDTGTLFWDEPEANLNPRVIKRVARTILLLCQRGIQVFIASHSLFLLRELDILVKTEEFTGVTHHFIGLHKKDDGVIVEQGESVDDIGEIAALQEELSQSDRYMEAEAK